MRIAVTGGSGFVGRFVVDELVEHGHEVVVVDLRRPAPTEADFVEADVTDPAALPRAFAGVEAVVHLAAVPRPSLAPAADVWTVNTLGTLNALEAAVGVGAHRLVLASTDSVLGFPFRTREIRPAYLPIDEEHPLLHQDPYGLSKAAAEEICRTYARRRAITTVCLRLCLVWDLARGDEAWQLIRDARERYRSLWVYVHARDAARAYRLSCERDLEHETVFVSARDALADEPVGRLLADYYPGVTLPPEHGEHESLISGALARERLGFEPERSWRDFASARSVGARREGAAGEP